ncbi:class I tRNA ligase family protein [Pseudoalteromonas rubra]|uniref:Methionine--tRNA ligase n=1 Tax=Pseudoalteromonas rubra TaxID=43658 RepID=A0A0U3GF74_9GAMM|nr:class I tRNA ligase family protein [Pseudoalteromonas rubra]ALU41739.1 hypothetical protein AT705_01635 [Pseudoalteromonas rubra]
MQVKELSKSELEKFYNVYYLGLDEGLGKPLDTAQGMVGIVSAGTSSTPHAHHETEFFIILTGQGVFDHGNGQCEAIEAGTLILSESFRRHSIINTGSEDLFFVSIWWREAELERQALAGQAIPVLPRKAMLIATPPTPNGNLHLGHLSGPYLAADVMKRYLVSKGVEVNYATGLDRNQSYVPLKAQQHGQTAEQTLTHFSESIKQTYQLAGIDLDLIISPDEAADYDAYIQAFFTQLHSKGVLIEKEEDAYFCDQTGEYLFEAYIKGTCPHCGAGSDGSACEQCGLPNQCVDLIAPQSKFGSEKLLKKRIKRLYLPVHKYMAQLKAFWQNTGMKAHLMQLCHALEAHDDLEIAVTHPTHWGIKSTISGYEDQVYYVWAEMAAAFIYMSEQPQFAEQWSLQEGTNWADSSDAKLIHFFGFDNGNFFTALFPCLWWGYNEKIKFPDRFITNEFLCLEGEKFSTSRGHAIWGNEFFKKNNPDIGRFYLALNSPESFRSNFSLADFQQKSQYLWAGKFSRVIGDFNTHLSMHAPGSETLPEAGAWNEQHVAFYDDLRHFAEKMEKSYHPERFSLHSAANTLVYFIEALWHFSQSEQYLFNTLGFKNQARTSLQLRATALVYLGYYVSPLMPKLGEDLLAAFQVSEVNWEHVNSMELAIKHYKKLDEGYFSAYRSFERKSSNEALAI